MIEGSYELQHNLVKLPKSLFERKDRSKFNSNHYIDRSKFNSHHYIDECSSECDSVATDFELGDESDKLSSLYSTSCNKLLLKNVFKRSSNPLWTRTNGRDNTRFDSDICVSDSSVNSSQTSSKRKNKSTTDMERNLVRKRKLDLENETNSDTNDSDVFVKRKKLDAVSLSSQNTFSRREKSSTNNLTSFENGVHQSESDEGISMERNDSSDEMVSGTQEIDFGANSGQSSKVSRGEERKDSMSSDDSEELPVANKQNISSSLSCNPRDKKQRKEHSVSPSDSDDDNRTETDNATRLSTARSLHGKNMSISEMHSPIGARKQFQDVTLLKTPNFLNSLKSKPTSTPVENANSRSNEAIVNRNVEDSESGNRAGNKTRVKKSKLELVRTIENKHFDQKVLFTEQLSDDDEIWLCQSPNSLDIKSLLGVTINIKGKSSFTATNNNGRDLHCEAYASSIKESDEDANRKGICCLIPSQKRTLRCRVLKLSGNINIEEVMTILNPVSIAVPSVPSFPDDLKVRHPLLGVDFDTTLANSTTKRNSSKLEMSSSKKNRKKERNSMSKLDRTEEDRIHFHEDHEASYYTASLQKKTKKKIRREREADEIDAPYLEEQKSVEDTDAYEVKKKKKKKRKDTDRIPYETDFTGYEDTTLVEPELLQSHKKKKKKKRKYSES